MDTGALRPWSLRFEDRDLEAAYRADHARRSVRPVRVMAAALGLASVLLGIGVLGSAEAETLGLRGPVSGEEPLYWTRSLGSLAAMATLVIFVGHRGVMGWQQTFMALLLAILLACDVVSTSRFPLPYGLTATLLQVMTAYVLLRLRLAYALPLGLGVSVGYLAATASLFPPEARLPAAFEVNVVTLLLTNLILAVACHQIEALDRQAFLGRYRVEQRSRALESALADLEQAQAELLEKERHASIGRLAAGLVHELNNPLGVLRSSADTLRRSILHLAHDAEASASPAGGSAGSPPPGGPSRIARSAEQLIQLQEAGVRRLCQVVEGLERFVDLDREGARIVDLRVGLRDAIVLLGPRLGGVTIEDELPEVPVWVRCEPARLNQAFFAVLENAANALKGRGHLKVRARRDGGRWRLEVEDDGPGVPDGLLSSIFEPGFSYEGTRVRMRLGLPTARRAVEVFGGQLELEPRASGPGTTVRFDLPASPPPPEAEALSAGVPARVASS